MRPFCRLLLALALAACATPLQTEKGGLVKIVPALGKAVDDAFKPRRFALVLGIDHTDDTGFRPLRFTAKDAQDVAAALAEPRLGAFDGVTVMTAPEQTTRAAVLDALKSLALARAPTTWWWSTFRRTARSPATSAES